MINSLASSTDLLSEEGPFRAHLKGFKPRVGQQQMAALIEQAISAKQSIAVEVASGSGKTLAYLVAAIVAGKKTVISTASHQLQHQLLSRDIPLVQRALGSALKVAMLMGRSNYLCPYYLNKHLSTDVPSKGLTRSLSQIAGQFSRTGQGELSHYKIESQQLKYAVTASSEECLGSGCPQFKRCPWVQAYQKFQQADIGVVNHSLLLTDKLLDQTDSRGLFASADVFIVDEAHRLIDFAGQLAPGVSSWQLSRFCRDLITTIDTDAPEQAQLRDYIGRFEAVIGQLKTPGSLSVDYQADEHLAVLELLSRWWQPLLTSLRRFAQRSTGFNELAIRAGLIQQVLEGIAKSDELCWFELRDRGFVLHRVPLSVSASLGQLFVSSTASWILTSATLAIAGSPERFLSRIGNNQLPFHLVDSDIDHAANALLYAPAMYYEPNDPAYLEHLVGRLLPLLKLVPGRSLLLFTSHRALQLVAGLLAEECECFSQGSMGNQQLLRQFKASQRGVLLGTGSFWEGLDLADTSLSFVCIDRLPFASPADPLVKLRSEALALRGIDAFQQDQLSDAVIRLRQGCGRLLRRLGDRGVIMVADPRLRSRAYGESFMRSLPPMQQVNSLEAVSEFFDSETVL
jgi:ATP-dependent DNA helicase DinG